MTEKEKRNSSPDLFLKFCKDFQLYSAPLPWRDTSRAALPIHIQIDACGALTILHTCSWTPVSVSLVCKETSKSCMIDNANLLSLS